MNELRVLLGDMEWVVGGEGQHIEESVKEESVIRCDPGIVSKEIDSQHIDFVWRTAPAPLCMAFMALIDEEYDLRGWEKNYTHTILCRYPPPKLRPSHPHLYTTSPNYT